MSEEEQRMLDMQIGLMKNLNNCHVVGMQEAAEKARKAYKRSSGRLVCGIGPRDYEKPDYIRNLFDEYALRVWKCKDMRAEFILRFLVPKRCRFIGEKKCEVIQEYIKAHPLKRYIHLQKDGNERESLKFDHGRKHYWLDFDNDLEMEERFQAWKSRQKHI